MSFCLRGRHAGALAQAEACLKSKGHLLRLSANAGRLSTGRIYRYYLHGYICVNVCMCALAACMFMCVYVYAGV